MSESPNFPKYLNNLGIGLSIRFALMGQVLDLEAIRSFQTAMIKLLSVLQIALNTSIIWAMECVTSFCEWADWTIWMMRFVLTKWRRIDPTEFFFLASYPE